MADFQPIASAPKDHIINLFCPGACKASKDVLQGIWKDTRWILNPYGTTQFTTLYPSLWSEIEPPVT